MDIVIQNSWTSYQQGYDAVQTFSSTYDLLFFAHETVGQRLGVYNMWLDNLEVDTGIL